jgi:flagellar hook-basal body complex protein FliE
MIEAIQAATSSASALTGSANAATSALTEAATGNSESKQPFADLITDSISQVNQAKQTVEGLMNGSGVDVHTAVIATQKADAAFELALSVRNKAVAAYQSVMGMQF